MIKNINEMAKAAYPKIMYCEQAYVVGAKEVLAVVEMMVRKRFPDYYVREMRDILERLRGNVTGPVLNTRQWEEEKKPVVMKNTSRVRCVNTGEEFDSIKEAAIHFDLNPSWITAAIRRNGKVHGLLFQKI
jgi:hypothetical protein